MSPLTSEKQGSGAAREALSRYLRKKRVCPIASDTSHIFPPFHFVIYNRTQIFCHFQSSRLFYPIRVRTRICASYDEVCYPLPLTSSGLRKNPILTTKQTERAQPSRLLARLNEGQHGNDPHLCLCRLWENAAGERRRLRTASGLAAFPAAFPWHGLPEILAQTGRRTTPPAF